MLNCLLLMLLNIVYLVCGIYPKHIIEVGDINSVVCVIPNLFYFALLSLLILISVDKNKIIFSSNIFSPFETVFRRFRIKKILFLIVGQIIIDIVLMMIKPLLEKNSIYLFDFFTVIYWILAYFLCANKEKNIFLKKSCLFIVTPIILLFTLSSVLDFIIIKNYDALLEKYSMTSEIFASSIANLDFIFQIKSFLLDTVIGLVIFAVHFSSNGIRWEKCRSSTKIIQVGTIAIFSIILIFVKSFLFPYSTFKGISVSESETRHSYPTDQFYASTETIEVLRKSNNHENDVSFQITKNRLFFNGRCVFECVTNDDIKANNYVKSGNVIVVDDCFEELDVNGNVVLLYKDKLACFVYNNSPVVLSSEGNSNVNDDSLLPVYKALIEKGCWEFYEQSVEYLKEHDPNFISSYIERHSSGQFNGDEIAMFDKLAIKQAYIKNIALDFVYN